MHDDCIWLKVTAVRFDLLSVLKLVAFLLSDFNTTGLQKKPAALSLLLQMHEPVLERIRNHLDLGTKALVILKTPLI